MLTAEDLFKLIFLSYWGLLLLVLPVVWLIVWKTVEHGKRLWVASLISLFIVISFVAPIYQSIQKDQQKLATKNEKYRAAKAVFDAVNPLAEANVREYAGLIRHLCHDAPQLLEG